MDGQFDYYRPNYFRKKQPETPMRQLKPKIETELTRHIIRCMNHGVPTNTHLCIWLSKDGSLIWVGTIWPQHEYDGPSCCVQVTERSTIPAIFDSIVFKFQPHFDEFPDIFERPTPPTGGECLPRLISAKEARQKVEALDDKQGQELKEQAINLIHKAVNEGKTYVDLPDAPKWPRIGDWLESHGYEVHCDVGQRGSMYRVKWSNASLAPSPHTEGDDLERIGW